MKTQEKFLIQVSLNGKTYPLYWLIYEVKNSETTIILGSYEIGVESAKTTLHSSGTMHTKEGIKLVSKLSNPLFIQKLDNFKGIQQILGHVIYKSILDKYQLRVPKIRNKQIIDIDISSFGELINLHIQLLGIENYAARDLYLKNLNIEPKFEEIIKTTSPWLYIVAF